MTSVTEGFDTKAAKLMKKSIIGTTSTASLGGKQMKYELANLTSHGTKLLLLI